MQLHHYSSAQSITHLKNGYLKLDKIDNPILLNRNIEKGSNFKKRLTNKEFEQQMQIQFEHLPQSLKGMMTFEYFLEQSKSKQSQIETQLHDQNSSKAQILFDQKIISSTAYLDLYQTNNLFNLWKYHADHFSGIVISLNKTSIEKSSNKNLRILKPINYTSDKNIEKDEDNPLPGIFDLPIELKNEKGWRLALPISQTLKDKENNPCIKIRKNDIHSITFGCNCDQTLIHNSIRYFKNDLNFKHLEFNQLFTSDRHFELTVKPINSAK